MHPLVPPLRPAVAGGLSLGGELLGRSLDLVPQVRRLRFASPMHDVGKIGIPDGIPVKSGTLDPTEQRVRRHKQRHVVGLE